MESNAELLRELRGRLLEPLCISPEEDGSPKSQFYSKVDLPVEELLAIKDDTEFVAQCFRRFFLREPSPTCLMNYTGALQGRHLSRVALLECLERSDEGRHSSVRFVGLLSRSFQERASQRVRKRHWWKRFRTMWSDLRRAIGVPAAAATFVDTIENRFMETEKRTQLAVDELQEMLMRAYSRISALERRLDQQAAEARTESTVLSATPKKLQRI